MTTKEQLVLLLYQIRGATSKLEKLKLAALAWRTLRGLDRHERLVVAKELGLGGAEHLVEQLGNQGGLSPAALLAAIHRAEKAEPEELRDLLGGVMDPERRDELLAGALQSAGDWLSEQEGLPPVPGGEEERRFEIGVSDPRTLEAGAGIAGADPSTATDPASVTVPATVPVRAAAGTAAAAGIIATATATDPASVTVPATVPVRAAAGAGSAAGAGIAATATAADPVTVTATATASATDPVMPAVPTAAESSILSALESSSSGVQRLRMLASREHGVADLSVDQLVDIVEVFPVGWARRRALESLLRRGVPTGFEDAMELVRRVADDGSRLWAATALAGRADLAETDKQMIEDYVKDVPVVERRVAIRLGRRRPRI